MNWRIFLHEAVNPANYQWTWHALPKFLEAFANLSLGFFVFLKNPRALVNRTYLLLTTSAFIWLFCYGWMWCLTNADVHIFVGRALGQFGITQIGPGVFLFSSAMLGLAHKRKSWIALSYAMGLVFYLAVNVFPSVFFANDVYHYWWGIYNKVNPPYVVICFFFLGLMLCSFFSFWQAYASTSSLIEKNRIKYVFLALGIAHIGSVDWLPTFGYDVYPFGAFPLMFFDGIMAYAIVSQKLFDIETVYLRTIVWAVTSVFVLTPLGFTLVWLRPWIRTLSNSALIGISSCIYLLFMAYTNLIQPKIDELFQRRKYDLNRVLIDILPELAEFKQLSDLVEFLSRKLSQVLAASEAAIFIYDENSNQYLPFPATSPWRPLKLSNGSGPFLNALQGRNQVMLREELSHDPQFSLHDAELLTPFNSEGKMLGFLAIGRKLDRKPYKQPEIDFLNRMRTSAAIAISNSLLIAKAMELEKLTQANEAKTAFVSMVSHEFRTPLTSIRGFVDLLKMSDEADPQARAQYLEIVGNETERLMRLINGLLDLAKLDKGGMELQRDAVDMKALSREAVMELQVSYPKLKFSIKLPENLTDLQGDRDRLKQILMNLLSNASKYSPEEGTVTLAAVLEHDCLKLWVEDEGSGIPLELQGRIFEKFAKLQSKNYKRKSGAGLGMAITKALVELHDGRIWIESPANNGRGSRFVFEIPINSQQPAAKKQAGPK